MDRRFVVYRCRAYISTLAVLLMVCAGCRPADTKSADARLDEAVQEAGYFGFQRAGELFESVAADSEPGSPRWQQAIYGHAVCLQQVSPIRPERLDRADVLYRQLIERSPDSKYAACAILNLGRMAELSDYHGDVPRIEAAREHYQKVIDTWPTDEIAGEATLRLAATYIQTFDPPQVRKGVQILESWLASHSDEPLAVVMYQYLGDTYFSPLEDYAAALRWYRKADVPDVLDRSRLASMYWRMAVMADQRLSDRVAAVEYYTKLIQTAPTGHRAYPAVVALQRLGAPVPQIEILQQTRAPAGDVNEVQSQ